MDSDALRRDHPQPAAAGHRRPAAATPRQRALVRLIGARLARARAAFRVSEIGILLLAAAVGAVAGLAVSAMGHATQLLHRLLFDLPPGTALSASIKLEPWRVLAFPVLAGLLLAAVMRLRRQLSSRQVVDPIEANALHGGRMSLLDSFGVGLETMISNGGGASVGLEAGYSQVGSGMASAAARTLGLRRSDVRLLVGCGAAGAIGAAFGAPLTGAFYAFELVIGGYTVPALAPVLASALAGSEVADALGGHEPLLGLIAGGTGGWRDQALLVALAPLAALAGIGLMLGVTTTEKLLRGLAAPRWLRPALGGAVVGGLGLLFPQVLSSGHGALYRLLETPLPLREVALVLLCKAVASAVSIGAGFRGGLFFASVFMGALFGGLYAGTVHLALPALAPDPRTCALIGMSGMAVAVVGGPLTMVFLALEMTRDFALAPGLIAAVMISTVTARRLFGFSFATWRFHLRGEAIRSAHDIGWIRNLTVGRLMRRDVRTVRADTLLGAFRRQFPLGSTGRVVAVDEADRYAGIVLLPEAHAHELDDQVGELRLAALLRYRDQALLASQNVKEAAALFERAEADALAVVDGRESRHVLGLLTEQHALRRYAEELDQRRRELAGEG